ncbi:MAG: hypothetical protein HY925_11930 [Elusimicrobia bacterium]|nr:hypothetical protein [Elusimicrobiota bacterium]
MPSTKKPSQRGRIAAFVLVGAIAGIYALTCSRPRDEAENWASTAEIDRRTPGDLGPEDSAEVKVPDSNPAPIPDEDMAGSGRAAPKEAGNAAELASETAAAREGEGGTAGPAAPAGTPKVAGVSARPRLTKLGASAAATQPGGSVAFAGAVGGGTSPRPSSRAGSAQNGPAASIRSSPGGTHAPGPAVGSRAGSQTGPRTAAAGSGEQSSGKPGAPIATPEGASRDPDLPDDGRPAAGTGKRLPEAGSCESECRARCKGFGRDCLTACANREHCEGALEEEDDGCRETPMYFEPVPQRKFMVEAAAAEVQEEFDKVCKSSGKEWGFVDTLVQSLQKREPRFGYLCRRGNCGDIKDDVIAFYAGPMPPKDGSRQIMMIDIILNCGERNEPQWLVFCWMPDYNGLWKKRR